MNQQINEALQATVEGAAHLSASFRSDQSNSSTRYSSIHPYRLWARLASDQFEVRAGLQKINFGSAVVFRPLMWFDAIDPRDPLQMTDGVYGILARYFFPDNSNVWTWGLYGNNERKGLEVFPTEKNSMEFGGRIQHPLGTGEVGATVHYRSVDLSPFSPALKFSDESRYALDGKWDIGIGLWFEIVVLNRKSPVHELNYQRLWTIGTDYTFPVGSGVNAVIEYFRSENPNRPAGAPDGSEFSAVSISYQLSLLDRVSVIIYRDWRTADWYRIISAQRTYDSLAMFVIGFWNPPSMLIAQQQSGNTPFAGTGIQLMAAWNH